MKIMLLARKDAEYDQAAAMVIVARDESRAREFAANGHYAEGEDAWYRPDVTVSIVGQAAAGQKPGIVLASVL